MMSHLWHNAGVPTDPPDEDDLRAELRERVRRKIREDIPLSFLADPLDAPAYYLATGPEGQRVRVHPSLIRDALGVYAAEEPGRLP